MRWLMGSLDEGVKWLTASPGRLRDLLFPGGHTTQIEQHRAEVLISRVRAVATIFAVLTPLWILIDLTVFPWPLWGELAALRFAASIVFAMLAYPWSDIVSIKNARRVLAVLMILPPLFFLTARAILDQVDLGGVAGLIESGYALLPFVILAGLSVFPLTVYEVVLFASPTFAAVLYVAVKGMAAGLGTAYVGTLWLLLLMIAVSSLSCLSQLHYMIQLVNQATHDMLTRAFTRGSGEEALSMHFRLSERHMLPLAVAFIDLDDFKSVNDNFGHDSGDHILAQAADALRSILRRGDTLVRWGGEEFVVVMVNTDCTGAKHVVERLRARGFGKRPDGKPLTASIGIAERIHDQSARWTDLVEKADARMYQAKQAGKNRAVICAGMVLS